MKAFTNMLTKIFCSFAFVMKQISIKIASIFLALVVFLSTMSFTVDMHFCGDFLVDAALFSKAESCGMEMKTTTSDSCSVSKKDCCSDENLIVVGQNQLHFNNVDYSLLEQQLFVTSFIQSYVNLFQGFPKQIIPYNQYSPPNLEADIQVLHQVFRI